jgi:RNA polymerase sigma factor (sigma-70 family)
MLSKVIDEIEEAKVEIVSLVDPAAEDAALVVAAKSGDGQAFEILVRRHQRRILTVAIRFTRVREDTEDIVQQSFQKAFVHLQQFEGNSSFSTWLTRIAINSALGELRKRRGIREVPMDERNPVAERGREYEVTDSAPNPEETYRLHERKKGVSAAIDRLRPRVRKVVEFHQLQEHSLQETAQILGMSTAAAKARMFHARAELRRMLGPNV